MGLGVRNPVVAVQARSGQQEPDEDEEGSTGSNSRSSRDQFYDVAIQKPAPMVGEWYGQLRMLFSCTGPDKVEHKFAFVRLYQDLRPAPAPYTDCRLLQWEEEKAPGDCPSGVFGRRRGPGRRGRPGP